MRCFGQTRSVSATGGLYSFEHVSSRFKASLKDSSGIVSTSKTLEQGKDDKIESTSSSDPAFKIKAAER